MIIPTFLKWAGGKRKLIPQLLPYFPSAINSYFEPFLGGGSVFFYIKQCFQPKKCILSDINSHLINAYKIVRDNPNELIQFLRYLRKKNSSDYYYFVREKFNNNVYHDPIKAAGIFIYLNKTCFNGLYRVNSKNIFNVPYGYHLKDKLYETKTIHFASKLLQGVDILHQDYRKIQSNVEKGDFVYLDPCYDPIKKTSFANYTPEKFSINDRKQLNLFINTLEEKGVNFALSNNNIRPIRKKYSNYKIQKIMSTRSIGAFPESRISVTELLIHNY